MASTTATALDNLVRIGQLKAEPRNDAEVQRMPGRAIHRYPHALTPQCGWMREAGRGP